MNLSSRQCEYLRLMGIDVWVSREQLLPVEYDGPITSEAFVDNSGAGEWETLRNQVSVCQKCSLHQGRTQTVFGAGDIHADWMIIGEAPGAEEDRKGEPFVGRAGKLLTAMFQAIGLDRNKVFITNILKCRPPSNRDPRLEEASACESYLMHQIALVKPKIILAVGRVAAQNLLKTDTPIGRMRGRHYEFSEMKIPVVVTYHPAHLLRSPKEKRKSLQDLQRAVDIYRQG